MLLSPSLMNKKEVRQELRKIVKNIPEKASKSSEIRKKLFKLLVNFDVIGLYASMENEVNLDELINDLLNEGKIILLPKIVGDDISFYQIGSLDELIVSDDKYHIREPKILNKYEKKDIEVIVVPALGFDKNNNRLGHGKGYYDRYLSDFQGMTIGVCYKEQLLNTIPHDESDIKVKLLITNK